MNVYIFEDVKQLTDRYHSSGGFVVVAEDSSEVMRLIKEINEYESYDDYEMSEVNIELSEDDWKNAVVYPTYVNTEPRIMVFPNAGCC